jgi:S1-C subfamily serine protease
MTVGGLIQSDVSLSPGYGGSPLLDSSGAVVGLNTDTFAGGMPLTGVGLAVPIEALTRSVDSVIKQGYVSHAWLGAEFSPDLSSAGVGPKGAMVLRVVPGGPADRAGVRPVHGGLFGDVIVGLQGQTVRVPGDVNRVLVNLKPGDAVSLSVLRPDENVDSEDYKRLELTVRLGAVQQRLQRAT